MGIERLCNMTAITWFLFLEHISMTIKLWITHFFDSYNVWISFLDTLKHETYVIYYTRVFKTFPVVCVGKMLLNKLNVESINAQFICRLC